MKKRPNPELIDDENPELTDEWFKRAVPFSGLPAELQTTLRGRPRLAVTKELLINNCNN